MEPKGLRYGVDVGVAVAEAFGFHRTYRFAEMEKWSPKGSATVDVQYFACASG